MKLFGIRKKDNSGYTIKAVERTHVHNEIRESICPFGNMSMVNKAVANLIIDNWNTPELLPDFGKLIKY